MDHTTTPHLRPSFPSATEIARARQRIACGDTIEQIAQELSRKPETLARWLARPGEEHPMTPSQHLKVTLPGGAEITGLSFRELSKLAKSL